MAAAGSPSLPALSAIDANTGLNWVARLPRQRLLSALATGTAPGPEPLRLPSFQISYL